MKKLRGAVSALLAAIMMLTALPAVTQAGAYDYTGLTNGQINIVKRARQLVEIRWTPQQDIYQWNYQGVFKAGTTYTGIPYGQPVYGSYVGFDATLSEFLAAVKSGSSKLYTKYSYYNKIAPYYSADCSGFLSYAWDLDYRQTTRTIDSIATRVESQNISSFQVGDCLNKAGVHVVLITEVARNSSGDVTAVEIMEETPVLAQATRYGQGGSKTLDQLVSAYLNSGYVLYRYPDRYSVTYTHDCAVPIDGDACGKCAPGSASQNTNVTNSNTNNAASRPALSTSAVSGGVKVTLGSAYADEIYYTTNGNTPTDSSKLYSSPFTLTETTTVKAIAVKNGVQSGEMLEYTVTVPRAAKPEAKLSGVVSDDGAALTGSTVELTSSAPDATIHYTTNGAAPTTDSKKYTGPITLTGNVTVKAIACAEGMGQSAVAVFEYKVGDFHVISAEAGNGGEILPSGTSSVGKSESKKYTITPGNGYKIADVTVDGVSIGAVSSYEFERVSSNHTIKAEFKSIELPFTDVKKDSWFCDAVTYAYSNSLFNGTTNALFSPDASMNRAMFVTVLGRLAQAGKGDENGYSGELKDLLEGKYYTPYVQWAYGCGIVSGDGNSNFNAEANVTREQVCIMLYKYAQSMKLELPETCSKVDFTDSPGIRDYAREAVYALQQAGVINGMGDGSFDPQGSASRAQVAQIFMRFANVLHAA